MIEAKSPGALAALGALEKDGLGRHVISETSPTKKFTQAPIQATLVGSDCCEAESITARGSAPVLALCHKLVAAGYDPATPLEAYRGNLLCLRVRSIREAAGLRIASHSVGFERLPECTGGSPVLKNEAAHIRAGRARQRGHVQRTG